eukprot:9494760-Karenia_brevis.AAC.1
MPRASANGGGAIQAAENRNRTEDYPDVEESSLAQLLCLGAETYGRWNEHCLTLVRQLARVKADGYSPSMLKVPGGGRS